MHSKPGVVNSGHQSNGSRHHERAISSSQPLQHSLIEAFRRRDHTFAPFPDFSPSPEITLADIFL